MEAHVSGIGTHIEWSIGDHRALGRAECPRKTLRGIANGVIGFYISHSPTSPSLTSHCNTRHYIKEPCFHFIYISLFIFRIMLGTTPLVAGIVMFPSLFFIFISILPSPHFSQLTPSKFTSIPSLYFLNSHSTPIFIFAILPSHPYIFHNFSSLSLPLPFKITTSTLTYENTLLNPPSFSYFYL